MRNFAEIDLRCELFLRLFALPTLAEWIVLFGLPTLAWLEFG